MNELCLCTRTNSGCYVLVMETVPNPYTTIVLSKIVVVLLLTCAYAALIN